MAIRNAIVLDSSNTAGKTIAAIRLSGSKIKYRKHAIVIHIEVESDVSIDKFKILVDSEWKTVPDTYIAIDNEWKEVVDSWVVVGGVWKC